jgi:hypothetical protein
MIHRPYLQITLSTQPLGLEEGAKGRNVTCQYVMTRRKKTKSAQVGDVGVGTDITKGNAEGKGRGQAGGTKDGGHGDKAAKDKGIKRKSESSQPVDASRGGKKRKK